MDILERNNVTIHGEEHDQVMLFVHGFGCDQSVWRFAESSFRDRYKTVLIDNVGSGLSDVKAYDWNKYETLEGYALDIIEICEKLELENITYVGHSVSCMTGVLAHNRRPELFDQIILIGPSPCYINKEDYYGGFEAADIDELLLMMDDNYVAWSKAMAPQITANADRPHIGQELTDSFCAVDPKIAKHYAAATFLSDNRKDLAEVSAPCLILQCSDDIIAPMEVGNYLSKKLADSKLVILNATGHCPHLSEPDETTAAINEFLKDKN